MRGVISDDDKYFNVVKNLSANVTVRLENLLESLTPGNRYNPLKQVLLDRYTESDSVTIANFFSNVSLGTRNPTRVFKGINSLR